MLLLPVLVFFERLASWQKFLFGHEGVHHLTYGIGGSRRSIQSATTFRTGWYLLGVEGLAEALHMLAAA
jgi:hypothetical protein